MSEREALLQAVYANPADDLPRMVLADWLDEHGEPERAELIRVQCELSRDPDRPDLIDRERELLADPARLIDPTDREAFELVPARPVFGRGFLVGVEFADFGVWTTDPPLYPVEEVGDVWHTLCDVAARHPLFHHVDCPGWFALAVSRDPMGRWVTLLEYERPRRCPLCDGEGWLGRAAGCPQCGGYGTEDTPVEFSDAANPWQTGRVRWDVGRALFGEDHPRFRQGQEG